MRREKSSKPQPLRKVMGERKKKTLLRELCACSLQSSGCTDRAKFCLFAVLSLKIQPREQDCLPLPALAAGLVCSAVSAGDAKDKKQPLKMGQGFVRGNERPAEPSVSDNRGHL